MVMAHAFVAGNQEPRPSDSERDISVGGVQIVPTTVFDGVDYVALGHLHGRHTLTGSVRYSGSPLAYSFSEADQHKGSWLVDLDADGQVATEFVDAPVPRPLARLRGTLDDAADRSRATWTPRQRGCRSSLTDTERPAQAKPRLERRFPHLLSVDFEPEGASAVRLPAARTGTGVSDHAITLDFVRDVRGRPADPAESAAAARRLRRLRPRPRRRPGGARLMRLHTLEITAFGPFADTVTVDFDALSEASVFLLCGDTGAGKTTVLDAVCFAFYGDVPSERSAAKQLRSHHAADGVAPRVVLDASLAGRRFRFTRSPQWQRPKKRGTGLTTQQAHVLVEEAVVAADGTCWRSLTNRLDEAGHLVTDLLGMTLGQFSQVVLLPQGQFDTFLRASSDDRHKVLTQLFRTRRFEDVERWLSDRRTTLRRAGERHHDTVAGLLHRVSEATGADLPSAWDVADLAEPAGAGDIVAWTASLAAHAVEQVTSSATTLDAAARALASATEAHDAGRRLRELRQRHATALAAQRALADTAGQAEADRQRLVRARRAAMVAPLARVAERSAGARERARTDANHALRRVAALLEIEPDGLEPAWLAERARHATERAAVARSFLPRARELAETTTRLTAVEQRRRQLAAEHDRVRHLAAALPGRQAALTVLLETQRAQAELLQECRAELAELARRVAFVATIEELEWQVGKSAELLDERRQRDDAAQGSADRPARGPAQRYGRRAGRGDRRRSGLPGVRVARPSAAGVTGDRRSDQGRRAVPPTPGRRRGGRPGDGGRPEARSRGPARDRPRGLRSRHDGAGAGRVRCRPGAGRRRRGERCLGRPARARADRPRRRGPSP